VLYPCTAVSNTCSVWKNATANHHRHASSVLHDFVLGQSGIWHQVANAHDHACTALASAQGASAKSSRRRILACRNHVNLLPGFSVVETLVIMRSYCLGWRFGMRVLPATHIFGFCFEACGRLLKAHVFSKNTLFKNSSLLSTHIFFGWFSGL
jgi:hypothetical protein